MSERGSVLALVPAGVLVLLVLAAIAVDAAVAFLAQRELSAAAAAAANDAAGQVSAVAFYRAGAVELDARAATTAAHDAVAARRAPGVVVTGRSVTVTGGQVCVTLVGRARTLFTGALPGLPDTVEVRGGAAATAVAGAPGGRPPPAVPCP